MLHDPEWEALVLKLKRRRDVDNPYALATWILEHQRHGDWYVKTAWTLVGPFSSWEDARSYADQQAIASSIVHAVAVQQ